MHASTTAASHRKPRRGPHPRRVPRAIREEQMLAAATRLFAARGFHVASMDEIARASGITKPMLYAYFDSKEGLFDACMAKGERQLEEAVREAALGAPSPEQRLWRGLVAVFRFFDENPDLFALGYPRGSTSGTFVAAAARGRESMARLLTALLADTAVGAGVDPDAAREAEPLAHALTGATIAVLSWSADRPEEPRELHALRLMNFAWMGLGNLAAGNLWIPPAEEGTA
ncbi:MAG TPA: TetR/AcrR family transcriptional regulator [Thermoleophilaceae bacterium]|jgi:AcrR family transcriptional regulator